MQFASSPAPAAAGAEVVVMRKPPCQVGWLRASGRALRNAAVLEVRAACDAAPGQGVALCVLRDCAVRARCRSAPAINRTPRGCRGGLAPTFPDRSAGSPAALRCTMTLKSRPPPCCSDRSGGSRVPWFGNVVVMFTDGIGPRSIVADSRGVDRYGPVSHTGTPQRVLLRAWQMTGPSRLDESSQLAA